MNDDLSRYSASLRVDPRGFWASPSVDSVSYPSEGNDECFGIEDDSFWFRHRNAVIAGVVKNFPPGGSIFDIGGGNGYVAKGLDSAGFPCVLVEPGLAGATHAVNRGVKNVIWSTMEAANFDAASLPAVALFDVLEHIEDDDMFLRRLHATLQPDGRIYLTVPALRALWSTDDTYAGHYRRYSTGSLTATLGRTGFIVEYVSYFFWFLTLPVFALRSVPSALGWRKSASVETARREHAAGGARASQILESLMQRETSRIRQGRHIPFGSSCVAVARRLGPGVKS